MSKFKVYLKRTVVLHGHALNPEVEIMPMTEENSAKEILRYLIKRAQNWDLLVFDISTYEDLIRITREYNATERGKVQPLVFRMLQKTFPAEIEIGLNEVRG